MSIDSKKIAILVDNYFEQVEFEQPLDSLRASGAEIEVISTHHKNLQGLEHINIGASFSADFLIDEIDFDDYEALVLPGGVVNADSLRMNAMAREWVNHFIDQQKLVAAICHAPWLLVSADVVEGRRLTSYFTLQDDIRNAGGEWVDQDVVIDGNIITSRKPDDIPVFIKAIEEWFDKVEQLS